ncbi:MAG: hypothetical protein HDS11_04355, partial [Bacteroides sp.]|nr:hypothetical protein [Bacteroides sp.]
MTENRFKKFTISTVAGAALLCGGILTTNQVKAATTETTSTEMQNTEPQYLTVKYDGQGQVKLLDDKGNYQDNALVSNGATFLIKGAKEINGQIMFRIGTQNHYIPAKFTNIDGAEITYNGNGAVTLLNGQGKYQNKYVNRYEKYEIFQVKKINGETMYRISKDKDLWVPSRYVKLINIKEQIERENAARQAAIQATQVVAQQHTPQTTSVTYTPSYTNVQQSTHVVTSSANNYRPVTNSSVVGNQSVQNTTGNRTPVVPSAGNTTPVAPSTGTSTGNTTPTTPSTGTNTGNTTPVAPSTGTN